MHIKCDVTDIYDRIYVAPTRRQPEAQVAGDLSHQIIITIDSLGCTCCRWRFVVPVPWQCRGISTHEYDCTRSLRPLRRQCRWNRKCRVAIAERVACVCVWRRLSRVWSIYVNGSDLCKVRVPCRRSERVSLLDTWMTFQAAIALSWIEWFPNSL